MFGFKKKHYIVQFSYNIFELEKVIIANLNNGMKCQGGIFIYEVDGKRMFYQAMVK